MVNSVEKVGDSSSYWSLIRWVRKPLQCLQELGKIIESSLKAINVAHPDRIPVEAVSYVSKGPKVALEVLKIRNIAKNVRKLISSPESAKKIRAFVSLTVNMNTVLDSVATVFLAIQTAVGPSAQKVMKKVPVVGIMGVVTLVSSFLSLVLSAYSAYKARSLFAKTNAASKKFFEATTDDEKAAVIKELVEILGKDGIRPLKKYLKLSKNVSSDFGDQIQMLTEHAAKNEFKDLQVETFMQLMGEKPFFLFYTQLDSAVNSLASIGKVVATVAKDTIRWISLLNILGFISSFLSLGISIYSVRGAKALLKGFNDAMVKFLDAEKKGDANGQLEALKEALAVIDAEGIVPLRTHLSMSKKAQETLATRVDALRGRTKSKEVHKDDADLIKILVGRAKTEYCLEVADVAAGVAGLAGSIIFATPAPVAGQIAGFSILAASSAVSLAVIGTRYFFIRKNPFDPTSQNRMMRMLSSLSRAVGALTRHCTSQQVQTPPPAPPPS